MNHIHPDLGQRSNTIEQLLGPERGGAGGALDQTDEFHTAILVARKRTRLGVYTA
jgi:hypothetical protein